MQTRFFMLLQGTAILLLAGFIIVISGSLTAAQGNNQPLPGPAVAPPPANHLAFVTFPDTGELQIAGRPEVATQARPLAANGRPRPNVPARTLFAQPDPALCQTDSTHAAPHGTALILQYNCKTTLFARLVEADGASSHITTFPQGYFLDWSPDGEWFLFRRLADEQVWLVPIVEHYQERPLNLPDGTYNAAFSPDGQQVVYAASRGLGLGSELGTLTLATDRRLVRQQFPQQVVAYPNWSPDGSQMVYILMADSNIPFTVGELWLADAVGQPVQRLDDIDAGRGYAPVWTPDGQHLVYVRRENPESRRANYDPLALHSNLYQVSIRTRQVTPLTHFEESLVYDAVWSPAGDQLAFTANDAVWVLEPGQSPLQVSPPGLARHPVWLSLDGGE